MGKGIVCAGHIIVDIVKYINAWPEEGMLVSIINEQKYGGGLVFNCLGAIRRLAPGMDLHAVGVVGDDQYGQYVTGKMIEDGIDCQQVTRLQDIPTSFTDVMTVCNGQRTFFHMEGANTLLDIEHLISDSLSPTIFHLGYLALLKTLDQQDDKYGTRAAKALHTMRSRGCKTSVDLVSVEHPDFRKIVSAALPYTDYLIINEIEAGMATATKMRDELDNLNPTAMQSAAKKLIKEGVQELVVIHCPEGGYGLSTDGTEVFIPSFTVKKEEIAGTVGAGDAFCSGVLYGLHEKYTLERAIQLGNGSARFSLLHETSTGGITTVEEITDYMKDAPINPSVF